jgi:hypothetical protein
MDKHYCSYCGIGNDILNTIKNPYIQKNFDKPNYFKLRNLRNISYKFINIATWKLKMNKYREYTKYQNSVRQL